MELRPDCGVGPAGVPRAFPLDLDSRAVGMLRMEWPGINTCTGVGRYGYAFPRLSTRAAVRIRT